MIVLLEFIKDLFVYVLIILIIVLIRIYIIVPFEISGISMEPNLKEGDMMMMDKLIHHYWDYERFNLVVLEYDNPKYIIKRIVGLPGEYIEYKDNKLYVNNKEVKEPFNKLGYTDNFSIKKLGYEQIPDNMYLVMGDNRELSLDSRIFGLVLEKEIVGKPFVRFWPFKQFKFIK